MAKMPLEQTYQSNDLGDQEDALIFRPELPPRAATTVQRSPPHVSNQNVFAVLVKNRRQITSLTAGMRSLSVLVFIISIFFLALLFFAVFLLIVDSGINNNFWFSL